MWKGARRTLQKILGYARRAVADYGMIGDGDKIAVGVSGGKDSVALLVALAHLRRILPQDFSVTAITLDPKFGGAETDYSELGRLCGELAVPHIIKRTGIGEIVFDIRGESNPCSLCARMRRGALHDATVAAGCNKVALGHHYDDALETFFLNLFNEGRIGCFSPVSYLSRKNITMIRPLIYAPESEIRNAAAREKLPIVKSLCPAENDSHRRKMKEYLAKMEQEERGFKNRIFGAMIRGDVSGWGKRER